MIRRGKNRELIDQRMAKLRQRFRDAGLFNLNYNSADLATLERWNVELAKRDKAQKKHAIQRAYEYRRRINNE